MVKETCLCGVHVHKATFILGIISLIVASLGLVAGFIQIVGGHGFNETEPIHVDNSTHTVFDKLPELYNRNLRSIPIINVGVDILVLIFTVLLLYGNRTSRPKFYLPFLVITVIDIVVAYLMVAAFLVFAVISFASYETMEFKSQEEGNLYGVAYLTIAVVMGLIYLLHVYFYYVVVNRSRRLLVEEQEYGGAKNTSATVVTRTYEKQVSA